MQKRKQYKGKSNRDFRKRPTDEEAKGRQFSKRESANDPAWYTVNGQMTKDVASLSFNNPSGIEYVINAGPNGSFVNPGIMNIYVAPVPGYSEGLSSPINIAAKNIYSWVRHANSGSKNYDSPDLILYLLAMDSAYSFFAFMTRIYGLIKLYSQTNRYMGANVIKAMHLDADSFMANLANFRAYVNQFALKLSALSVPSTMSLFKRHMWMFSNVFMDEDDPKGQMYIYEPAYFYTYDEYNGAGRCIPKPLLMAADGVSSPATPLTYGDIMVYGDAIIANLIGSEDINLMSGDILKAYGNEGIWKLAMIDENYTIMPMFSEEVLAQIHNTVFVGTGALSDTSLTPGWDSFNVEQDTNIGQGCLICKPLVLYGGNIESDHVLDFWKAEVTSDDIIVATRNMVSGKRWSQGFTAVTGFGTEIPIFAEIVRLQSNGTLVFSRYFDIDEAYTFNTTYTNFVASAAFLSRLSYFNEHPYLYVCDYNSSAPYATINATASIGEMSNFTMMDFYTLEKIHLSAILSELAVPMLGNIAK